MRFLSYFTHLFLLYVPDLHVSLFMGMERKFRTKASSSSLGISMASSSQMNRNELSKL